MKWTTANVKDPNYTQNHEIYVGTHVGSFKKLTPSSKETPFAQKNLSELSKLDKDSRITSLAFGNNEHSEIFIGRASNEVQLHCLRKEQVLKTFKLKSCHVVGAARYQDILITGFENGHVQCLPISKKPDALENLVITSGNNMSRLRQCPIQSNLIATGGKDRTNNLKLYDLAEGCKQIFASRNVPNDSLQLEVPVWDSDFSFVNSPYTLATCSRYGYVRFYDTRKQRRPVQCFASEEQAMSFAALSAHGNYIYTGTTMGALKAFDIRRMKNFVHTYKGFSGGISDLCLDTSGKFLTSACLDRYVRVHETESCMLFYQCYVKSKATGVLIREMLESPDKSDIEDLEETYNSKEILHESTDEEYEKIFNNMQTICEGDKGGACKVISQTKQSTCKKRTTKTIAEKSGKKRK